MKWISIICIILAMIFQVKATGDREYVKGFKDGVIVGCVKNSENSYDTCVEIMNDLFKEDE